MALTNELQEAIESHERQRSYFKLEALRLKFKVEFLELSLRNAKLLQHEAENYPKTNKLIEWYRSELVK